MVNDNVFRTVLGDAEREIEEKRSTFISAVRRVSTKEEAEAFVKERKKLHPTSRHTVFAYLLRDGNKRYGDDGEPQGTAGMPTLRAIEGRGLSDVCVATTRYFGGILLGTGGLSRAYTAAAQAALEAAGTSEFVPYTDILLELQYADHQRLLQELPQHGARERRVDFSDRVRMIVGVLAERVPAFLTRVKDLTAGRCVVTELETKLDAL